MATLEELEARIAALETFVGVLPDGTTQNTVTKYIREVHILAENTSAQANNIEQLAVNIGMMAQQTDEKVTALEENVDDAIERAETAAKQAKDAVEGAEEVEDRCEKIRVALCDELDAIRTEISEERLRNAENDAAMAKETAEAAKSIADRLEGRVDYLEENGTGGGLAEDEVKAIVNAAMSAKPEYKLPYTANELFAKLAALDGSAVNVYDGAVTDGGESNGN